MRSSACNARHTIGNKNLSARPASGAAAHTGQKSRLFRGRKVLLLLSAFLALAALMSLLVWNVGAPAVRAQSSGTIHYVAPGGNCGSVTPCYAGVQAAVDAAVSGDEIRIAQGTYNENVNLNKSLTLRGGYTTTNWTVSDPDNYPTVLNAGGTNQAVISSRTDDISVTLEALEITGGGYTASQPSGGIDITANRIRVTIRNCSIHDNYDYWGSAGIGITAYNGYSVVIENNRVYNNSSDRGGTGIGLYVEGALTIRGNRVTGNTSNGYAGSGIGLYGTSDCVIEDNVIAQNNGGSGLDLQNCLGHLTVTGNRIWGNTSNATIDGGGVNLVSAGAGLIAGNVITGNTYAPTPACDTCAGALRLNGPYIIRNNFIRGNNGAHTVVIVDSNAAFENNVVVDNAPGAGFDVIRLVPSSLTGVPRTYRLVHNTMARNGNAVAINVPAPADVSSLATAYITNTIVYSHGTGVQALSPSIARLAYSLLTNTTNVTGNVVVTTGVIYTNPVFLSDGYHISTTSPAKDAGIGTDFDYDDVDDQMRLMGPATDIGADELQVYTATLTLSKSRQGSGAVQAGQPITYILTISNAVTSTWAADVRVVDRITSAYPLAGLKGSGPNAVCQAGSSVVTCTVYNVPTTTVALLTVVLTPSIPTVQSTQGFASADNLGVSIPDDGCGSNNYAEHTIAVNASGTIQDVDVLIKDLQHTYDGDLNIYVRGPDGTQVELSTGNGGGGDNYVNTIFDDEASDSITAGSAPFTGRFKPEGSLSAFDGKAPGGNWMLRICDSASQDTGILNAWGLTLTLQLEITKTVSWVITDTASLEALDAYDPITNDNSAGPVTVTVSYTPPAPDLWVTKSAPQLVEPNQTFTYTVQWGNRGSADAEGVVLTDTLPTEVTFQAADGNPTRNGRYLTWTLGTVGVGVNGSYLITVTVGDLSDGTTLTNTAGIDTSTSGDPTLNNTDVATTTVYQSGGRKVTPKKRVRPQKANLLPGENLLTYTVDVTNTGIVDVSPIIRDPIPKGTTYVPGSAQVTKGAGTVTYHGDGNYLEVQSQPLAPGQVIEMQFRVRVTSPDGEETGRIRNRAEVQVPGVPYVWRTETETEIPYHDLWVRTRFPRYVSSEQGVVTGTILYGNVGTGPAYSTALTVTLGGGAVFSETNPAPSRQISPTMWVWESYSTTSGMTATIQTTLTAPAWQRTRVQAVISSTVVPTEPMAGRANRTEQTVDRLQTRVREKLQTKRYFSWKKHKWLTEFNYFQTYDYETTDPNKPYMSRYRIDTEWPLSNDDLLNYTSISQPPMSTTVSGGGAGTRVQREGGQMLHGSRNWVQEKIISQQPLSPSQVIRPKTTFEGSIGGETVRASTDPSETPAYTPTAPPPVIVYPQSGDVCRNTRVRVVPSTDNWDEMHILDAASGEIFASGNNDYKEFIDLDMTLPEGFQGNIVARRQGGIFAPPMTSTPLYLNTQNVYWDPQASRWWGVIQAGPEAGTEYEVPFVNSEGRYSTNGWQAPGRYGFWGTTFRMELCQHVDEMCPEINNGGDAHFILEADGIPYTGEWDPALSYVTFNNIGYAHTVSIKLVCTDGDGNLVRTIDMGSGRILIDPDGYVFNVDKGGSYDPTTGLFSPVEAVSGVTVTAYVSVPEWGGWIPWPAHLYDQVNPQVTDNVYSDGITTTGYFAFYTPPGFYYLEVEGIPGYQKWRSPVIEVITQVVHMNVPYTPWPDTAAVTVTLTPDGPDPAVVTVTAGSAVQWVSALRATDTITDLVRWSENPILNPRSTLDPLKDTRGFDAGYLEPGRVYRRQFDWPGEYTYTDATGHTGKVVVTGTLYDVYLPLVLRNK